MSRPPLLGDLAVGRDNNLNLLRFAAALGVMVSHTVLVTQGRDEMPSSMWLLGHICVGAFFVISGFLIPASFERAASARDYVLARLLRIMPALAVCVLVTALVVGPAMTELSTAEYFRDGGWAKFIFGNLSLVWEVETLPGVFGSNPEPDAQITFWTLKHEAGAYAVVLLIGVAGFLRDRVGYLILLQGFAVVWFLVAREIDHDPEAGTQLFFQFVKLLGYFFLGMTAHVFRARLPLFGSVAVGLVAALWVLWWTPVFYFLLPVTVAYCVLWCAYVPRGPLLAFNRLGDYSYGIYVYGALVQQLCVALLGPQSPVENFLYALGPTLLLAALSWHFIERPCLSLRKRGAVFGAGFSVSAAAARLGSCGVLIALAIPAWQEEARPVALMLIGAATTALRGVVSEGIGKPLGEFEQLLMFILGTSAVATLTAMKVPGLAPTLYLGLTAVSGAFCGWRVGAFTQAQLSAGLGGAPAPLNVRVVLAGLALGLLVPLVGVFALIAELPDPDGRTIAILFSGSFTFQGVVAYFVVATISNRHARRMES